VSYYEHFFIIIYSELVRNYFLSDVKLNPLETKIGQPSLPNKPRVERKILVMVIALNIDTILHPSVKGKALNQEGLKPEKDNGGNEI